MNQNLKRVNIIMEASDTISFIMKGTEVKDRSKEIVKISAEE